VVVTRPDTSRIQRLLRSCFTRHRHRLGNSCRYSGLRAVDAPVSARIPHRLRRWRVPAYVLLGIYLLYLLAGNIFLNTPLFDQVTNRKPHKFVMTTGPAITCCQAMSSPGTCTCAAM
jgi:hypothetical protein